MKAIFYVLGVCGVLSHAGDFAFLQKNEAKAFETAHRSIEDAFAERNLSPIASFGPSILARYSAVLLQSDPWAKKLRPAYHRLDSLVAYAIVRGHTDSLSSACRAARPPENELPTLRQMDRLLASIGPTTVLCALDKPYCDSLSGLVRSYLQEKIPAYAQAMKAQGKMELAYQGLQGLSFQTASVRNSAMDIEKGVEKEFRKAMSSYDREELLAFRSKYPAYKPTRIEEKLGSLEADEIFHLLSGRDQGAMVHYLQANPSSPYGDDVRKRLEPLLLATALDQLDPEACRIYLGLFSATTVNGRKVAETLSWMMRPASDSGAPGAAVEPVREAEAAPSPIVEEGADGPRTSPLPEGYSPLLGQELGRMGIRRQP